MFSSRSALTLALLAAAISTGAQAQSMRTRAEVQAELREAIRTGNMIGNGEAGLTLRELNPERYGAAAAAKSNLTRAQVGRELEDAQRSGDVVAAGELGLHLNEANPGAYPEKPVVAGKTRVQVQAELREAIRTGDMIAAGESSMLLKDMYPERYAKVRAGAPVQAASPSSVQVN